jgi:predicted ATP-grasp superfamily ATP-dependent carboligase
MKTLVILYAESEYTPWKENIDSLTVNFIRSLLEPDYKVDIRHMEYPTDYLGKLLREYDGVINLCYGFMEYSQAEIANWLDNQRVNHFSSPGWVQRLVQDKLCVEKKAVQLGIQVPLCINHQQNLDREITYILKPRFGSCHQGIHILKGESMQNLLNAGSFGNHILQEYIAGREFSVAVIPSDIGSCYKSLPPVEIVPNSERVIFIAGNSFGSTHRSFSYELDSQIKERMMTIASEFHEKIGLRYMSRMDFRLRENEIYLLDVNAMPNLHPIKSLLPALLEQNKQSMKEFFLNKIRLNGYYTTSMELKLTHV